jgi:hypothetical protein
MCRFAEINQRRDYRSILTIIAGMFLVIAVRINL